MIWASGLEGRESVGPVGVNVDASARDLLEFVDVGGGVRYTAERESIQWFIEASYVELSDSAGFASLSATVELGQMIAEGGMSFTLSPQFALYGGARYQSLDLEIVTSPQRRVAQETDWIDAIGGFRWTPFTLGQWTAWLRGDVGAGGSDFQWLAEVGVKWQFASAWSAQVAYRTLDVDYQSGAFAYDMRQSGLVLGLSANF
jgi:opacity protein-like surface antigen